MAGLMFVSVWFELVWVMYAAVAVRGVAFAGGALAWNLGHNDFARDDNAAQYMAVHVTLTGIRGLAASFVPAEPTFDEDWFRLPSLPMTYGQWLQLNTTMRIFLSA